MLIEPAVRGLRSSIQPVRVMRPMWSSGHWPRPRPPVPATFISSPAATASKCDGGSTGCCNRSRTCRRRSRQHRGPAQGLVRALDLSDRRPQEGRIRGVPGRGGDAGQHVPDLVRREGRGPDVRRAGAVSCAWSTWACPTRSGMSSITCWARHPARSSFPVPPAAARPPRSMPACASWRPGRAASAAWRRWKIRSRPSCRASRKPRSTPPPA